ncbi:hypothetical protein XYCOK13_26240 [Xylanibacillus composti]|uniref:GH18 domain-containing protein n=2 Tax=Xylanibacillus composti TaxID=1572762 RepID=A0A8J4M369_9BACL|nr:hypothetical protein XYCOK13_26240 [Xylanibacillus composti]
MGTRLRIKTKVISWLAAAAVLGGIALYIYKLDSSPDLPLSVSAWVVDWQLESGLQDYQAVADHLDSLHMFALYYDDKDGLTFTPALAAALSEMASGGAVPLQDRDGIGPEVYLTVVNDVWLEDGTSVQKDSELVTRLAATPQSRSKHVQELVAVVLEHGFDGLEIDYERIAEEDWERLEAFFAELQAELEVHGKSLRVILEPRAPIERLSLPAGPSYVLMAYNLFGTHSGPGPKADQKFLRELAARSHKLPGEPIIALASGGFAWSANGDVKALTEQQALALADQAGAAKRRDQASGAVFFEYTDEQGVQHTVWYADASTFKLWVETLREAEIQRVAMWRLGEWSAESLRYLAEVD